MLEKPHKKLDRRVRRTRKLLREALMDLVVEQGYESITVQDIADRADIARTTFYMHYRDKEDLLTNMLDDLFEELIAEVPLDGVTLDTMRHNAETTGQSVDSGIDFWFVDQHRAFFKTMLGKNGSAFFVHFFRERAKEIIIQFLPQMVGDTQPNLPHDFVMSYVTGATMGVYNWWLEQHPELSYEEVDKMHTAMLFKGMLWALGAEDEDTP